MLDRLPDFIDPTALADKRRVLSGSIELNKFDRLSELLFEKQGDVRVELAFARKGRLATVHGSINGLLVLVCQACLQGITIRFDADVNLGVVSSLEMAEQLSAEYEPLLFDSERLSLPELVEDEILLVLPDFPRHAHECQEHGQSQPALSGKGDERNKADNPFSVLANLKKTGEK